MQSGITRIIFRTAVSFRFVFSLLEEEKYFFLPLGGGGGKQDLICNGLYVFFSLKEFLVL